MGLAKSPSIPGFAVVPDPEATLDGVPVVERRPMPPLGHFSLVRSEKIAAAGAAEDAERPERRLRRA
jgi:hypothetical protein